MPIIDHAENKINRQFFKAMYEFRDLADEEYENGLISLRAYTQIIVRDLTPKNQIFQRINSEWSKKIGKAQITLRKAKTRISLTDKVQFFDFDSEAVLKKSLISKKPKRKCPKKPKKKITPKKRMVLRSALQKMKKMISKR